LYVDKPGDGRFVEKSKVNGLTFKLKKCLNFMPSMDLNGK